LVERYPFATLPDLLAPNLRLVFVGINPSIYSVERGRYFARKLNRFWPAFSRSTLSAEIRSTLGREMLGPEDDEALVEHGIGFTDLVKLPSRNVSELRPADFQEWAPRLLSRLEHYRPRVACFQGITGYRAFTRYALGESGKERFELGPQRQLGTTWLYVVPNPSPANAHFTPREQSNWYDRLGGFLEGLD
jgi:TDG/mug DNA glycosylase family protein